MGLLLVAGATGPAALAQAESDRVRAMYEQFREAMRDDDGEQAVELIAIRSLQYFERIKRLALHAEENEVRVLPPFEQYYVMIFRHELSPSELADAEPRLIATWFINEGWFGSGIYVLSQLEQVEVTGDWATAKVMVGERQAPFEYQFWREGSAWKIDLSTTHKVANQTLLDLADRNKLSVSELIGKLVEAASGRPVNERVWQPMTAWAGE